MAHVKIEDLKDSREEFVGGYLVTLGLGLMQIHNQRYVVHLKDGQYVIWRYSNFPCDVDIVGVKSDEEKALQIAYKKSLSMATNLRDTSLIKGRIIDKTERGKAKQSQLEAEITSGGGG